MREPFVVWIGDLHAGSTVAPGVAYTSADGAPRPLSRLQERLVDLLDQAWADTQRAAAGCDIVLLLGGDLIDGDRHHGTHQTNGSVNEQIEWAEQLLKPWADIAAQGYGLLGTDAHVGHNGTDDKTVCGRLGFPAKQFWRLRIGGRLLDWAHHASGSRKPWLSASGPVSLANKTFYEYLEHDEELPSVIARHHMHYPNHVMAKGIQVVSVPGWQAQTDFSYRIDPNGLLDVGVAWWWPRRDKVQVKTYSWPAEGVTDVVLDERTTIAV